MAFFMMVMVVGLATYLTRLPGVLLGRSVRFSARIQKGLSYIPIGVFAAMIAPVMFGQPAQGGQMDWLFLGASAAAVITAWISKSPLWTMIIGSAVIAGLRLI
jgi:branched-subunit amino acid transport protein